MSLMLGARGSHVRLSSNLLLSRHLRRHPNLAGDRSIPSSQLIELQQGPAQEGSWEGEASFAEKEQEGVLGKGRGEAQ